MQENANIEIVRQIYRDFLKGDFEAVLNALAEDIDWDGRVNWPGGPAVLLYEGRLNGRSEVARGFELLRSSIRYEKSMAANRYVAAGNWVLVTGKDMRRDLTTGELTENRWSMLWTFDQGKVVRFRMYQDTVEMLEDMVEPQVPES